MSSLEEAERISAEGATAPRVSVKSMEAKIASVYYVNARQAVNEASTEFVVNDGDRQGYVGADHPLALMTLAFVTMHNGFVVVGKSAPASPENFDEEKGKLFAYEDAIRQLWPLEGYLLREQLGNPNFHRVMAGLEDAVAMAEGRG